MHNDTIDKGEKRELRNWIISLLLNLVILLVILNITGLMYETNDDFTISREIADGYPYVGFVNYYLCRILIEIQKAFPDTNMFVVSQMALSLVSFTAVIKVFLDRSEHLLGKAMPVIVCAFFALDHYSCIQFTKTSALLMAAGLLWLTDNYLHDRRPLYFAAALLLFYLGAAYRQKAMLPAIAFAVCFVIAWWILNGREYFKGRNLLKESGTVLFLLVLIAVPYGLDKWSDNMNASTPELKYAREYQAERIKTTDYPLLKFYDEDDAAATKYTEAGFSRNDLHLVVHFTLDYDGAASLKNLKRINDINKPYLASSKSWKKAFRDAVIGSGRAVKNTNYTGMHIIIIVVLVLLVICTNKPKAWLYAVLIGMLSVCMYTAIYYMQRPQYRALYVVDVCAAFWLLYASAVSEKSKRAAAKMISATMCVIVVSALFFPGLKELESQISYNRALTESEAQEKFFAENNDNMYVCIETMMELPLSYLDPLKTPEAPENVTGTGGWETLTPYKLSQLEKYGMTNPIKDLVNSPNTLLYGDAKIDKLAEYYNKWYGNENEIISIERIGEFEGNGIYRVIREQIVEG